MIPPDASVNVQRAFRQLEDRLAALENKPSFGVSESIHSSDIAAVRRELRAATWDTPFSNRINDVFRSGAAHAVGLVPDPGGASGATRFLREFPSGGTYWVNPFTGYDPLAGLPLTTKGDLLTRSSSALVRKGVGTDRQHLGPFAADASGLTWFTPPSCVVRRLTPQSINDNTSTLVNFDTEDEDNASMHDTVTNNTRITIPVSGRYLVWAAVEFATHATGIRSLLIRRQTANFTLIRQRLAAADGADVTALAICCHRFLSSGDYIECEVYQNSGGALNVNAVFQNTPYFGAMWLGD
jgi:hypothetical protein